MGGAKWDIGLMILVLNSSAAIVNAISCPDAISTLTPCLPFLLGLPSTPSDACCAGAQKLDKLPSSSPVERKNLCECFVGAIKSYPVNLDKVQQLPKLCKLQVTLPSDRNVDCNKCCNCQSRNIMGRGNSNFDPRFPFLLGNSPPLPSDASCAGAQKLDKLAASSSVERKHLC